MQSGMLVATRIFFILILAAWLTGCGVGYRYGATSIDYSVDPGSLNQSAQYNKTPSTMSTTYHEFRLIDTTGLLMAGLVNTSRQYSARQKAIDEARYKRDARGRRPRTVEYSYKPYGIYPGSRVTVDFRLGSSPTLTPQDDEVTSYPQSDLSYWGADVIGEFTQVDLPWLPNARLSFYFGARFENVDYNETSALSFNSLALDVTVGTNLGVKIWDVLLLGTLDIGVISPIFKFLVPSEETSYLNGTVGFEAVYYPLSWLGINANFATSRWLDGGRRVSPMRAGIGVVLESDFDGIF